MRATLGVELIGGDGVVPEGSELTEDFSEGSVADLANDVGADGSSRCGRKVILPNTQSINGL